MGMNIQITAKKIEIPTEIRDYVTEKLQKLEKFNQRIQTIEAVLKAEVGCITCDVVIKADNIENPIVLEVQGDTIQSAVDLVEAKAERQLRKSKERASVRRRAKPEDREMP